MISAQGGRPIERTSICELDTSAPSNTVVFLNNPFWAKHQNYCNLVFSNMVTTNLIDFYNGNVSTLDPAAAMTISGDMTVVGKIKVQEGADFTIQGNSDHGYQQPMGPFVLRP